MKNNYIKIGKQIRLARERIGMTQEELSTAIECTPQHISGIERGVKFPKLDTLIKIINTLRVSPDILFQDVVDFQIEIYDKEFSSLVGWLSDEDTQMILKVVKSLSTYLYERKIKEDIQYKDRM